MMTESEIRRRLDGFVHSPLESKNFRLSAVLVPLEAERGVWLTRRTGHLSSHAGQVAFPGGRIDDIDQTPEAAALREAHEEIGLKREDVTLIGRLDDLVTGTGFHVTPVVGLVRPGVTFAPSADEVAALFCMPFDVLLDPAAPKRRRAAYRGGERDFWVWPDKEHLIWGATAAILVTLAQELRRPA